ncbi:hypothetical protein [Rhodocyclus purpureus]|uniref:hypothetical protein n=1 Tax=Rhodocyclus purpureus TaxID=1067 RepID=UPI00191362B9|nr:hypothetical protein [Rhodocyclus purpureus]
MESNSEATAAQETSQLVVCPSAVEKAGYRAYAVLIALALWLLGTISAAASDAPPASLRPLADRALTSLAERIEPPPVRFVFGCAVRRSEGAPLREYILRQQAQAIDALLTSATTPEAVDRVTHLLERLQRDGYAGAEANWLSDTSPGGPVGLRLADSLGELPEALEERMHPGCRPDGYIVPLGRDNQKLGAFARTDYQRLTEQEPGDPWHWLVLGWLAGPEGEAAVLRSLAVAKEFGSPDAARAQIFAWQQMAWLRRQQGRGSEALSAALEALRLAENATGQEPAENAGMETQAATEQAWRDFMQAGSTLAITLEDIGKRAEALDVLEGLLPVQRQLVELRPEDMPAHYALIDTLLRMGALQDALDSRTTGASAGQSSPTQEAFSLLLQLQQRTPYTPMLSPAAWHGVVSYAVNLAALLTLPLGWALLWRYRRRIAQLMKLTADRTTSSVSAVASGLQRSSTPIETVADEGLLPHEAHSATVSLRRAVVVEIVAGLAFGLVAAWLQLRAGGHEPNVNRIAMITWPWAWPTVLALGLIWGGDRHRTLLALAGYFIGLLLICAHIALGDTPTMSIYGIRTPAFFQGLVFWVTTLSASPILLLFLNRAIRSIGPSLLAMMLVATAGGMLAQLAASTPAGMTALVTANGIMHLPTGWVLHIATLAGMVAFAPLAWVLGKLLRTAYAAKWLSDQSLVIDTLWIFQASLLSIDLTWEIGHEGWIGLGAFLLYKLITVAGMWPAARAARKRKPLRLLLLRVFSRRDKEGKTVSRRASAEKLFDLINSRWRYAGPIYMIAAPDLASSTIDPDEFLDFLAGRLHERFILNPSDLQARLAALDDRCDFDARWRATEFFCGEETWRTAVQALMARSDLVAMDLRDFRPENEGCRFELQALVDLVPIQRVLLLVDKSTDISFLKATLDFCIGQAPANSPNAKALGEIAMVNIDHGEQAAVDRLLQMGAAG